MNLKTMNAKNWIPRICSVFIVIALVIVFIPASNQTALGQGNESELHDMRSQDEITSGTLLLKEQAATGTEGVLDFDQMRKTQLNSTPPPVFAPEVDAMEGKEVTMYGFMTPYDSLTNFTKFMIFPSATGCQFCAVPSPKEVVFVRLKSDKEQEFIPQPIKVTGKLSLWKEGKSDTDEAHKSFLFVINEATVSAIGK